MLNSIHEFLYDHRGWVSLFTIPTGVYYGYVLVTGLIADHRGRQLVNSSPQSPVTHPPVLIVKPPIKLSPASDRLAAARDAKGRAQTEVLDEVPQPAPHTRTTATEMLPAAEDKQDLRPLTRRDPAEAETVSDVFSGLDDAVGKAAGPSTDIVRKANRLEQLGFHVGIVPDEGKPAKTPEPAPAVDQAARQERLSELGLAPAAEAAPAKPPAPQLDAILAKLDQVLSGETKPVAETPAPSTKKTEVPLWARADSFDDDVAKEAKDPKNPKQLGLFDKDTDR